MRAAETNGFGEQVVRTATVFAAKLEGRHARGIAQEGEVD